MSLEKFHILSAKILSEEASPEEMVDFQKLISENPEWKDTFLNMEELWNTDPEHHSNYFATEESYLLHLGRLKDHVKDFEEPAEISVNSNEDFQLYPVKSWYQKWQVYAAAVVFLAVAAFSIQLYSNNGNNAVASNLKPINEISVKPGAKTSLKLPDGSHVWVNSDSKLSYPETFQGNTREVFLEGEAFFDIVKDPSHPFIVHTSGIDVKVLGTAFNVKAYNSEPTIEATLVHGLIEVTKVNQSNASKVILKPHEKLIFNKFAVGKNAEKDLRITDKNNNTLLFENSGPAIIIAPLLKNIADSAIIETSWVYNRLSFEEEKLEDLAVKMERWFNVKIKINNESIRSYRLTGSFQDETIDEALKELQYLVSFSYKMKGKEVVINKK